MLPNDRDAGGVFQLSGNLAYHTGFQPHVSSHVSCELHKVAAGVPLLEYTLQVGLPFVFGGFHLGSIFCLLIVVLQNKIVQPDGIMTLIRLWGDKSHYIRS